MAKSKPTPKPEKIRLRGAEFRHIDMRVVDGNAFVRAHMRADITPELAEYFHWEIYRSGHLISGLEGATKLAGELQLEELSFSPNGTNATGLECVAATAEAFQLSRSKSDTGGTETSLFFQIKSSAWKLITDFFGLMGTVDGAMVLTTIPQQADLEDGKQMSLDEQPEEPASAEAAEEPTGEPESKDSRIVNGGRPLMSHRQSKLRKSRQPDESAADDDSTGQPVDNSGPSILHPGVN